MYRDVDEVEHISGAMNITRTAVLGQVASQTKTSTLASVSDASAVSQSVRFESHRSSVLMESNLNVKSSIRVSDRRSLISRDEKLMKILSAQPDEPLVFDDRDWKKRMGNGVDSSSGRSTSSQFGDDHENLPPQLPSVSSTISSLPLDRALAATEASNMGATSTPPRHINQAFLSQIKRDLNSPSALARHRALRALRSPTAGNYYMFDVPHEEEEIVTEEERNLQPKTIQEVMKDVVAFVEVRTESDNRTDGIKEKLAELGAQVNDRLNRNTTHVVFKDGKNSTYERAKSLNIPIVSVLWIEACRKHLCLMDAKGFPISELDRYENPLLYGKMKRHKSMQPGAVDKILNRKVPKSKLLENSKMCESPALSRLFASPATKATAEVTATVTPTSTQRKAAPSSRKAVHKTAEKPSNTIRAMFMRQMERSQSDKSGSDQSTEKTELNENETERGAAAKAESAADSSVIMTPGKLHSRLTRRNSMNASEDQPPASPRTTATPNQNRRRTLFMSSIRRSTIQEEASEAAPNETLLGAVEMEETLRATDESRCNSGLSGVGDALKTPSKTASKLPDGADVKRSCSAKKAPAARAVLTRRTLYTPQAMDETRVASSSRRKTLNFSALPQSSTPRAALQPDDVIDTVSCDAAINKSYDFSQGMPKLDGNNEDLTREGASRTLLEQYSTSFHSSRSIVSKNRRTIADISMDIIRQRMDNINKIASINRSIKEPVNHKDAKPLSDSDSDEAKDEVPALAVADGDKPKPLKRKLFAPPSLFSPVLDIPHDSKSVKKRGREDLKSESKNRKSIDKRPKFVAGGDGTPKARRSTMLFQPTEKSKVKEESAAKCNNNTETPKSVLVFTNMHQEQIEAIKEAVQKLGKFTIESNVSKRTTHVVTLEPRRTVNLLRAMIRGLWIVEFDWIEKSLEANEWLSEEPFEMTSFSKMVKICRTERHVFGRSYRMDIFSETAPIYISKRCACKSLAELVKLCRGQITPNKDEAKYVIDEANDGIKGSVALTQNWILDCITNGRKILNFRPYLFNQKNDL